VRPAVIEIFNYLGAKIISQELKDYSNMVSIKELNSGLYLYRITIKDEVIKTDKLIVTK